MKIPLLKEMKLSNSSRQIVRLEISEQQKFKPLPLIVPSGVAHIQTNIETVIYQIVSGKTSAVYKAKLF